MKTLVRFFTIAVTALLISVPAQAQPFTVYTNSSDFLNAITGASFTTNFISVPNYQFMPNPSAFSGNGFSYNIYSTTNNPTPGDSELLGLQSVPGQGWVATFSDIDSLVFSNFVYPTGLGLYGIGGNWFANDANGFFVPQQVTVVATLIDNSTYTTNYTPADFASSYVGFTAGTNFRSLVVSGPFPTVTDIYAGAGNVTVVPEPSTYALLALVAVGFAGYLIRRRHRA